MAVFKILLTEVEWQHSVTTQNDNSSQNLSVNISKGTWFQKENKILDLQESKY